MDCEKRGTAFLDTSTQIERAKPSRHIASGVPLDALVASYSFTLSCGYSRLEFKRAFLQRIDLAVRLIEDFGGFFGALDRSIQMPLDRQRSMLVSILSWAGRAQGHTVVSQVRTRAMDDRDPDPVLSQRALAYLSVAAEYYWHWFEKKVGHVVDSVGCSRGREAPVRRADGKLDITIPVSKCRTGSCGNRQFIVKHRAEVEKICKAIDECEVEAGEITRELAAIRENLRSAIARPDLVVDYRYCTRIGDAWIHLEAAIAGASVMVTTNYKESSTLCPALSLEMKVPDGYPGSE